MKNIKYTLVVGMLTASMTALILCAHIPQLSARLVPEDAIAFIGSGEVPYVPVEEYQIKDVQMKPGSEDVACDVTLIDKNDVEVMASVHRNYHDTAMCHALATFMGSRSAKFMQMLTLKTTHLYLKTRKGTNKKSIELIKFRSGDQDAMDWPSSLQDFQGRVSKFVISSYGDESAEKEKPSPFGIKNAPVKTLGDESDLCSATVTGEKGTINVHVRYTEPKLKRNSCTQLLEKMPDPQLANDQLDTRQWLVKRGAPFLDGIQNEFFHPDRDDLCQKILMHMELERARNLCAVLAYGASYGARATINGELVESPLKLLDLKSIQIWQ